MVDSQKVQWNGYLCKNMGFLFDMGCVLMMIVEDVGSVYDVFYGFFNEVDNEVKYGVGGNFLVVFNVWD